MKTWIEEKNQYKIEHGSELKWIELHEIYHGIGLGHILSDVDVIIEMEKEVIFMEFKNYDLSPTRVDFSELNTLKKNNQIARKYYDSFLTISSITELTKKKYRYFFVLNHTKLDAALRFRLYEIIRKSLPFRFFKDIKEVDKPLINEFRLLDIEGWNNLFPQFKLEKL